MQRLLMQIAGSRLAHRRSASAPRWLAACVALLIAGVLSLWLIIAIAVLAAIGGAEQAGASCAPGLPEALPPSSGVLVAATVYEGEGAGAYGAGLAGHLAFAELGLRSESDSDRADADRLGLALGLAGALAPFTKLRITLPGGRSVLAEKRDIGMGGPPIDGHARAIDLWTSTRIALGLPADWSGLVRVQVPAGGVLDREATTAPAGAAASAGAECGASAEDGSLAARIVSTARSQVDRRWRRSGGECNPYGPCEPWCSLFATWVWRRAGVRGLPSLAFSGAFYEWARARGDARPPSAAPMPGWAVFFGSGPASPQSSLHVALIEAVLPGGQIVLINGNFADRVMRTGPCLPADAAATAPKGCEAPGPIYGYAAP